LGFGDRGLGLKFSGSGLRVQGRCPPLMSEENVARGEGGREESERMST